MVDSLLRIQHNIINESFELNLNMVQHKYVDVLYRRLCEYVSIRAFKLIRDQSERGEEDGHDFALCGFNIRTTYGLPCGTR
ncbi:hypothetical protein Syun_008707 [Stephania yunnanensis]|uniref:Uncharacterized protein n=1 Tax=Stephania yunnanensis TaxID=152371 RepID=A0AAP0PMT9_9MAGN